MTTERRNEILDLVIKGVQKHKYFGLCQIIMIPLIDGGINRDEKIAIVALMRDNKPKLTLSDRKGDFWWPITDRQSRIEFCKMLKQKPL